MPHDVPLVVYRNGERVVIGNALVNSTSRDGTITMIARINDEMIVRHLDAGGDFGAAEFALGDPDDDSRPRIFTGLSV